MPMSGTAGCIPLLIAQVPETDPPQGNVTDLHILLLMIIAIAVTMGIVGYLLIRKYRHVDTPEDETPFTLSQLRRIYEAGEISLEEFEHMRETMIAKVKAALGTDEITVHESPNAKSVSAEEVSPDDAHAEDADAEQDTANASDDSESGDVDTESDVGPDEESDDDDDGDEDNRVP